MKSPYFGRKKAYSASGINRVACFTCGKRAHAQWNICANDNRFVAFCKDCDIKLNQVVLKFAKIDKEQMKILMDKYKIQVREE